MLSSVDPLAVNKPGIFFKKDVARVDEAAGKLPCNTLAAPFGRDYYEVVETSQERAAETVSPIDRWSAHWTLKKLKDVCNAWPQSFC